MRKFVFNLEKVLDFRKHQEDELSIQLALLRERLRREEEFLEFLRVQYRQTQAQLRQTGLGELAMEKILILRDFLAGLEIQILHQSQVVAQAAAETEECRLKLLEARQNYKILEKLRERDLAAYQSEVLRQEQALLDEIGAHGYIRNRASEALEVNSLEASSSV
ncbi:MAG: flagellar export protein FliJ [Firmicutes bacterium]|nr:flagellar export protein FliJ [Bacillota bacterium]